MYTIYCDGEVLYSPRMVDSGYIATDAVLELGVNRAGSLDITIPYNNPAVSKIVQLKSDIVVERDSKIIFKGRVIEVTQDFNRNRQIVCEGPLAFLNDVVLRPYSYVNGVSVQTYFSWLFGQYNSQCDSRRRVNPGTFSHSDPQTLIYINQKEYSDALSELSSNLIDGVGGYLLTRYADDGNIYVDYKEYIEEVSSQEIEFAANLLSLDNYIDASSVYTVIIPLGKQLDSGKRLTISGVNSGKDYLESATGISTYGKITKVLVWDEIDNPSMLKTVGQMSLESAVKMAISITATAIDLHLANADVEALRHGTLVPITSVPHGLSRELILCSEERLNLLSASQSEYTLGVVGATMTSNAAKPDEKTTNIYKPSSNS